MPFLNDTKNAQKILPIRVKNQYMSNSNEGESPSIKSSAEDLQSIQMLEMEQKEPAHLACPAEWEQYHKVRLRYIQ